MGVMGAVRVTGEGGEERGRGDQEYKCDPAAVTVTLPLPYVRQSFQPTREPTVRHHTEQSPSKEGKPAL